MRGKGTADGEPLDIGGSGVRGQPRQSVSFKDKVLYGKAAIAPRATIDLIQEKLIQIELEDGNCLKPKILVSDQILKELSMLWEDALIVKLLGKTLGYSIMKERLQLLWNPSGGMEIMDVGHGFYMIKFDIEEDRLKAISRGPWMIFDHYLFVQLWSVDFVAAFATIEKTFVWIQFPSLNLAFYDESFLLALASAVGRPNKVDLNTLKVARGRFACVCVEIDLNLPVVGRVCINNHWHNVEYEGLHLICCKCGCYGHLVKDCPLNITTTATSSEGAEHRDDDNVGKVHMSADRDNNGKGKSVVTKVNEEPSNFSLHGDWTNVVC